MLFSLVFPLLINALFIALPFGKTYITADAESKLITTGLYALIRHPGAIFLALTLISVILISRSYLLLIATPIWLTLDILLVMMEERFIFRRMFRGNDAYQKTTPMLLPNKRSFTVFLNSLGRDKK